MATANGTGIESMSPSHPDSLEWLSVLLHTTDSAYPIGGFAHSGGLEGMVGLAHLHSAEALRQFLQQEIADVLVKVELPLLHHAWLAAIAEDEAVLQTLDQISEATRFTAEQRQASRRLGQQRFSLFDKLQVPHLPASSRRFAGQLRTSLPGKHLCIVAGIEAALLSVPVQAAMISLAHQSIVMVAQASLKLLRIGQTSVQALVAEMTRHYPALIATALQCELEDIGTCQPVFDAACAFHETAPARLFLS